MGNRRGLRACLPVATFTVFFGRGSWRGLGVCLRVATGRSCLVCLHATTGQGGDRGSLGKVGGHGR